MNRDALRWQFDWRSNRLMNLRILVCSRCLDKPQEQYRPIVVPPDPVPTMNPRPDLYAPRMPYILADTNGNEITDTTSTTGLTAQTGQFGFITATSQTTPTAPGSFDDYRTVTPQAVDQYEITAPDGGPVLLIPT